MTPALKAEIDTALKVFDDARTLTARVKNAEGKPDAGFLLVSTQTPHIQLIIAGRLLRSGCVLLACFEPLPHVSR